MISFYRHLFTAIFSLFAMSGICQQKTLLLSADFRDASFSRFVQEVESQTPYYFYFRAEDVSKVKITLSVKQAHLNSVLDQVFTGTDLQYTINENKVFITSGFTLATTIGSGIHPENLAKRPAAEGDSLGFENMNRERKVLDEISIQNKLFEIGQKANENRNGIVNLAGYIRDGITGEAVSGAVVYVENPRIQVNSDQFGYYSITLNAGRQILNVISPGKFDAKRQLMLYSSGKFDVNLEEKILQLKEVKIDLDREKNIRSTTMGAQQLDIAAIKQIPAAFGEVDVIKAVLALPGVKSVGEASTGMNVRGGSTDQNLILFNGANIFNPSHLFGFFSAFDADVVKDVTLYKSSIPASLGGRISSVLDITSLDGNDKKLSGNAGIGPLTGRFTLEGPLIKDKTTFVAGVRTTYSNWLFDLLPDEYKKSKASFQDATLHISHKINDKNQIYLNGYISGDKFKLNTDTTYQYKNKNINLKWKHNFNNRFYGVLTAGADHYDYAVQGDGNPVTAYKLSYSIDQLKLNTDFNYFLSNKHKLLFGMNHLLYKIHSGSFLPKGTESLVTPEEVEAEQALESAFYVSDQYNITADLSVEAGIRFSLFNYLGPKNVNNFTPGLPREENSIINTDYFRRGSIIKTYGGPEYRVSARYLLSGSASVKGSYNTLRQYLHMLSNTATISPTDIWKLSDRNIKPQEGSQVSLGFYKNFKSNTIETSVEIYYKWFRDYLDYKSGAALIMNKHIETDVFSTKGKSYGVELMVKKTRGKLNGWIGYTYSRSFIRQDDPLAGETINSGQYYPTNFDQPHSGNFVGNYRLSHRFSVSLNVAYSTGRPITIPVAVYDYAGSSRLLYSNRNEYRIPDYFRTDFSLNVEGNHKVHQKTHNSWTFGIYNFTARKNAYSVYYISENRRIKGYKLSIFGTAIPFISYNIRF